MPPKHVDRPALGPADAGGKDLLPGSGQREPALRAAIGAEPKLWQEALPQAGGKAAVQAALPSLRLGALIDPCDP